MAGEKVLIVEDDKNISKLLKYNLEKAGFEATVAETGEKAVELVSRTAVELIVLDIMLPKMDGLEVCKEVRKAERSKHIPVIMLTAKGEEVDRVLGFELGADDYLVKPFSPRELILRIKAILKRGKAPEEKKQSVSAEGIVIDISRHKVTVDKKEVELTLMEFNLLVTLIERRGRVQSREKLLSDVWGIESEVTTRTIDTHVKRLREKLGKAGKNIETIRGLGYRFGE